MPEKSASGQVRPNTPGGIGQAPIQSGQAGPGARTPLEAVDETHQGLDRPATGLQGAAPAPAPDPDSPGAKLARDKQAAQDILAEPGAPSHCTVCGVELIGVTELAQGPFDQDTGKQLSDQEETGGNEGFVAVIQCPNAHETWRKVGGSFEREDTRMSASQEEADESHGPGHV